MARRKRVKELIELKDESIERLWNLRNVDFYGNSVIGEMKRTVTEEEAEECLDAVENRIERIEEITG